MLSLTAMCLVTLALPHQQFCIYLFTFKEINSQHNKHVLSHTTGDFGTLLFSNEIQRKSWAEIQYKKNNRKELLFSTELSDLLGMSVKLKEYLHNSI